MLSLFTSKTSYTHSGALKDATDWHCHLLPGVDDGIAHVADTLRALRLYEEQGLSEVWFTPHIMEDMPNATAALRTLFAEVEATYLKEREAWKHESEALPAEPLKLHLAAENMLDGLFDERFKAGDLLPIGAEADMLLVETSYLNPPMDFWGTLREIQGAGYHPLLAHPERYRYMDDADYERLHDMGIRLQLNLPSLLGAYGTAAQKRATHLLRKGYYFCAGTDTHRVAQLSSTFTAKGLKKSLVNALKQL